MTGVQRLPVLAVVVVGYFRLVAIDTGWFRLDRIALEHPQLELDVIAVGAHFELDLHLLELEVVFAFVGPFSYLLKVDLFFQLTAFNYIDSNGSPTTPSELVHFG